jgi:Ner family transcriptional regulator
LHTTDQQKADAPTSALEENPMTKPREWDRHSILAHLRRNEMTLEGIAKRYEVSLSGVKNIWTRPNEKVERAMADFIGAPVEKVFPDRYPKKRNRILASQFLSETSPGIASPSQRNAA